MIQWDNTLWLLTEREMDELPAGTRLMSINNRIVSKDDEDMDRDTRFGVLAYGLTEELIEEQGLADRVLLWRIRGHGL
jgi:hypothetical protein